jgi:hypothetical protein
MRNKHGVFILPWGGRIRNLAAQPPWKTYVVDASLGAWNLNSSPIQTEYANTDFDLMSDQPFDALQSELAASCQVLHYTHGEDGRWYSIVEAVCDGDTCQRDATRDILSMLTALNSLSERAKQELAKCSLREFNLGFHCGDSWGYVQTIPQEIVRAVADASCSLAVTLYPMRNADGTAKG